MKKKLKIIMLPTDEASILYTSRDNPSINTGKEGYYGANPQNQHLYLVSDEEIKEGDNICWKLGNEWFIGIAADAKYDKTYKVIATTDLIYSCPDCELAWTAAVTCKTCDGDTPILPQIPESFIKQWVESNGTIKEVEIEVDVKPIRNSVATLDKLQSDVFETTIKLTDNNEVIIDLPLIYPYYEKVEEKMYSREEVVDLLSNFVESEIGPHYQELTYLDKWIKENL